MKRLRLVGTRAPAIGRLGAGALVSASLLVLAQAGGASAPEHPRELGRVSWERDFEAGVRRARSETRPVFLLFQEVPGCATCVGFGETVLSHPLLVEAIETEFVPVAVFNNLGGRDREVLERFGEPAWNNPVVRFVDAEGRDWVPRAEGVWSPHGIASRMIAALEQAGRPVPAYLELAAAESRVRVPEREVFETHCFWEGEGCLGSLPGVVATEAAWLGGSEVVVVHFDPRATSRAELLGRAEARGCASAVIVPNASRAEAARSVYGRRVRISAEAPRAAGPSDQKRHLRGSPLAGLDLSPLQQARVNAALAQGTDPFVWLSPSQRAQVRAAP